MEDWKVTKTIRELSVNGVIPKEKQLELFKQMHEEIDGGVPLEESTKRAILIQANKRLLISIIMNVAVGYNHVDEDTDLFNTAKLALIEAIDTFDYTRDISFSTYAYSFVRLKILHYFQKTNRKKRVIVQSLSEIINDNSENRHTPFDIADDYNLSEDVDGIIDAENYRKYLFSKFKYLTNNEQSAIVLYYGFFGNKPASCPSIGKKLGVSQNTISLRLRNGVKKLALLLKSGELTDEEQKNLEKLHKKKHPLIPCIQEFFDKVNSQTSSLENI